jgi:hypothetical protein
MNSGGRALKALSFQAERAGLQRLVAEVQAIHEQRDEAEIESMRNRIRVQDDLIRQLTADQHVPIKVIV